MKRGFVSGLVWGGVLAGLVLALASQKMERRVIATAAPETTAVDVPAGTPFDPVRPETDPRLPGVDPVTGISPTAPAIAPGASPESMPARPGSAPAAPSEVALVPGLAAPVAGTGVAEVPVAEAPILTGPETPSPILPGDDIPPDVVTPPAGPGPGVPRDGAGPTGPRMPDAVESAPDSPGRATDGAISGMIPAAPAGVRDAFETPDTPASAPPVVGPAPVQGPAGSEDTAALTPDAEAPPVSAPRPQAPQTAEPDAQAAAIPAEIPLPPVLDVAEAPVMGAPAPEASGVQGPTAESRPGQAALPGAPEAGDGGPAAHESATDAALPDAPEVGPAPVMTAPETAEGAARAPGGESRQVAASAPIAPEITDAAPVLPSRQDAPESGTDDGPRQDTVKAADETGAPVEPEVVTDRLPRIGDEATPDAPAAGTGDAPPLVEARGPDNPGLPGYSGVVTDRLPRIGDDPAADDGATEADKASVVASGAFERNAETFENPEGRPVVAVVLLDGGGPVMTLPFAFSVALRADAPDVANRAAAYRAAGREVLLIPALPQGGRASDVSVALQSSISLVPGAVAVLDTRDGAIQSSREVAGQAITELADSGHGLVTFPKGLNTAQQLAARAEVPAGLVFREIDGEGQDSRAVKRFLDQAAFRARQEEAVILVGHNRPETIAALLEWVLGNRAASVALAPVSAALRRIGS